MNWKTLRYKSAALATALMFCLPMAGCQSTSASEETTAVQSVSLIMGMDLTGTNRYTGVAQAKSIVKVNKDGEKAVGKCYVKVGDEVSKGDVLFRYDADEQKLAHENGKLELEQLKHQIQSYKSQLAQLEKEKKKASKDEQFSYTLQIQETELELQEAQFNLKKKKKEVKSLEKATKKTKVYSPVDGVIQKIQDANGDSDYDYYGGGDDAYITIMETGTYNIKAQVSETNVYSLYEGMPMLIMARSDDSLLWHGTISKIDTEKSEDDNRNQYDYYDGGSGESATKYDFYVALDNSDGLMMGQHVYLMPDLGTYSNGEIAIPSSYLELDGEDAYVWACNANDRLEKRAVTLGAYDEISDTYVIESGLTLSDYIALVELDPKAGSKVVKYDETIFEKPEVDPSDNGGDDMPTGDGDYDDFGEDGNFEDFGEDGGFEDFGGEGAFEEYEDEEEDLDYEGDFADGFGAATDITTEEDE